MIKLNRTSEYGLIALRHISRKHSADPAEVTSAREIADTYGLPFEITAKTLQRLKDRGLILSAQGARGGYTLQRPLNEITLADFISLMEGPQALVPCVTGASAPADTRGSKPAADCACEYSVRCEMQGVMSELNRRVVGFLTGIRLADLTGGTPALARGAVTPLSDSTTEPGLRLAAASGEKH